MPLREEFQAGGFGQIFRKEDLIDQVRLQNGQDEGSMALLGFQQGGFTAAAILTSAVSGNFGYKWYERHGDGLRNRRRKAGFGKAVSTPKHAAGCRKGPVKP